MKITELKCTACNGTLKVDEANPHIAVCEYCKTRYVLEDEGEGNVRLAPDFNKVRYEAAKPAASSRKTSGRKGDGWKRVMAVFAFGFLIFGVIFGGVVKKRWDMEHKNLAAREASNKAVFKSSGGNEKQEDGGIEEEREELTGCFADMAAAAFGKPAEGLTEEELSRIQRVEFKYANDSIMVGYSFSNPDEDAEGELTWMEFPRDKAEVNMKVLSRFTGLKALKVAGYLSAGDIKGLKLNSLGCYAKAPGDLKPLFEDPGSLKELGINAGLKSLEGIGDFTGLERLTLDCYDLTDIKPLVNMKGLKSLAIENGDEINGFSVFSVMNWLEELSVDSEALKDIGFVKCNPSLSSLSIKSASILNVDALAGIPSLTSLSIERCGEVKDLSAVSGLAGLTRLALEVPYNCPQPDLSMLPGLESLRVQGMDSVAFLQNMPLLEELELEGCTIDRSAAFQGLGALRSLKCARISDDTDWGFVTGIPALETLDLRGITTYRDISGLFRMQSLKALYLNGVECELDFSKLAPNESLEILKMDGVKLYKNVQISGGGGFRYIDWDDVNLDEHTDFLGFYPGLKELSLADNKLTQIAFAPGLVKLETLNISGNYVTDIKPLESLGSLRSLNCQGNPVENYRVLREDVAIIQ